MHVWIAHAAVGIFQQGPALSGLQIDQQQLPPGLAVKPLLGLVHPIAEVVTAAAVARGAPTPWRAGGCSTGAPGAARATVRPRIG
jgi:hypothetical protein